MSQYEHKFEKNIALCTSHIIQLHYSTPNQIDFIHGSSQHTEVFHWVLQQLDHSFHILLTVIYNYIDTTFNCTELGLLIKSCYFTIYGIGYITITVWAIATCFTSMHCTYRESTVTVIVINIQVLYLHYMTF